jgi:hypothetical protein
MGDTIRKQRGAEAVQSRDTSPQTVDDPFLELLESVEIDDEPLTDEDRAAIRDGWDAYVRGESRSWEDVRRSLLKDDEFSASPAP